MKLPPGRRVQCQRRCFPPGRRPGPCEQGDEQRAAAAAASRQSCLTLCDPRDGSPPGSAVPGTLQARTLESIYHHSLVIAQFLVKPRISVSNYINAVDSMSE